VAWAHPRWSSCVGAKHPRRGGLSAERAHRGYFALAARSSNGAPRGISRLCFMSTSPAISEYSRLGCTLLHPLHPAPSPPCPPAPLRAWASANRLVLGRVATSAKSNEITAGPNVLCLLLAARASRLLPPGSYLLLLAPCFPPSVCCRPTSGFCLLLPASCFQLPASSLLPLTTLNFVLPPTIAETPDPIPVTLGRVGSAPFQPHKLSWPVLLPLPLWS
jgi:hypothetical protein